MNTFLELNLPRSILSSLELLKFSIPTPIQVQAIPPALAGKDLIGCAQTGTGKTAAFSVPTLCKLIENPNARALFLVPTRELAVQIHAFWGKLTQHQAAYRSVCVIGGTSMFQQKRELLRKPRVIIATPGRLLDHLQQRNTELSQVSILVLDEADRMLDMGFILPLTRIIKQLPHNRHTMMFSATWQTELDRFAKPFLKNPIRVEANTTSSAAPKISQRAILTTHQRKNETLLHELQQRSGSILIFARTKSRTDQLARYLARSGVNAGLIHGGRSQSQRLSALAAFRRGQSRVLVATDIAARGIDVPTIQHVVNYDLPRCSEDYIHRIGRTGRAGMDGNAVSLVTPEDQKQWRQITRLLQKTGSKAPHIS